MTDEAGKEYYSRMHAVMLESVASAGEGFAVPAGTADVDMADFYERMVTRLDPQGFEAERREQQIERYQWPAAAALLLLLADTMMTDRKREARRARQSVAA